MRLTVNIRKRLRDVLLAKRFDLESKQLAEDRYKLADDVWNDLLTCEQQQLLDSLPKGWLPKDSSIAISFDGDVTHLPFKEYRLMPYDFADNYKALRVYEADHVFTIRYKEIKKLSDNIQGSRKILRRSIMDILNSIRTVKRLKEIWPEVSDAVDEIVCENNDKYLPAISTKDLNEKLGL